MKIEVRVFITGGSKHPLFTFAVAATSIEDAVEIAAKVASESILDFDPELKAHFYLEFPEDASLDEIAKFCDEKTLKQTLTEMKKMRAVKPTFDEPIDLDEIEVGNIPD